MRPAMQALPPVSHAPLAHSIGTPAKQDWEKGETSLGSPPILRLAVFDGESL
jgi:hypothetical protein